MSKTRIIHFLGDDNLYSPGDHACQILSGRKAIVMGFDLEEDTIHLQPVHPEQWHDANLPFNLIFPLDTFLDYWQPDCPDPKNIALHDEFSASIGLAHAQQFGAA